MLSKNPVKLNPLSPRIVSILMSNSSERNPKEDTILANATGSLFKEQDHYFLITNWHNVTGFNPETNKRLDKASPLSLIIHFPVKKGGEDSQLALLGWQPRVYPLYDSAQKPQWYIHPQHGNKVDVVALAIGINDTDFMIEAINDNKIEFDNIEPEVGDDVFIIGFPHNYNSGGKLPIWKRGSIASEPQIDLDKLPKMLVDTASRPGMSGSPVIYRRTGIHKTVNGELGPDSIIGTIQGFCGIYSGRLQAKDALDTQLGIVWKKRVIDEIIQAKSKDDGGYYPGIHP